ncbi:MFS general substrate transporter like [Lecanosticta acicola]|uniref:MFS general substrate transporter like n=1 Tax=Lecanosticta acicola TaxID=111012 RepID=A0AAI9EBL8_9PEZI|nr:MFS general substrate transporter like [Lecanosticta acicola]
MAPKVNCNPQKLAAVVAWLQKSRTCYNIKDLEKHLPSVASINSMQVKDESMIRVEKIGSGNWYWSFASQDKKNKQDTLTNAQTEHAKAESTVRDLRHKLAELAAQKEEEEEMMDTGGEGRDELTAKKAVLEADLKALEKELESYSDNDPVELERKRSGAKVMKTELDQVTDDIYSLEKWFKVNAGDEAVAALRMGTYGGEWDSEECDFKELVMA